MRSTIAKNIINKISTTNKKNAVLTKINRIMKKHKVSLRSLNAEYNSVYKKFPIPHSSFYHKMNNATFTDVELYNLEFIAESIEREIESALEKMNTK